MQTTAQESAIKQKTLDLCQALIEEPQMKSIRQRIDTFMQDEKSRSQYDTLVSKGQSLQEKERNATPLTSEEISAFEEERDALLKNPVARGFLDAQQEMHEVRETIQKYVTRTLELGRIPTEDDFGGCCDSGCGCGHGH